MTRVDNINSERVYNELKSFENTINWDGNTYIGNQKSVKFSIIPSMSTRSIYVSISNWDSNETSIRISDHQSGMRATDKDIYFTFDTFDMETIKEIYRSKLN